MTSFALLSEDGISSFRVTSGGSTISSSTVALMPPSPCSTPPLSYLETLFVFFPPPSVPLPRDGFLVPELDLLPPLDGFLVPELDLLPPPEPLVVGLYPPRNVPPGVYAGELVPVVFFVLPPLDGFLVLELDVLPDVGFFVPELDVLPDVGFFVTPFRFPTVVLL